MPWFSRKPSDSPEETYAAARAEVERPDREAAPQYADRYLSPFDLANGDIWGCKRCGAYVYRDGISLHDEWHMRLEAR